MATTRTLTRLNTYHTHGFFRYRFRFQHFGYRKGYRVAIYRCPICGAYRFFTLLFGRVRRIR